MENDHYKKALNEMVTQSLRELGEPKAWGVKTYGEVIKKEIAAAGGIREYATSGTFPFENNEIIDFMKKHNQEPDVDKYFSDLTKTLETYKEPGQKLKDEEQRFDHENNKKAEYGNTFSAEEKQKYADEKRKQLNNLGMLKDNMLEEVFKDNQSFQEYIDSNANVIGRMGVTNQFSVAVDSPGVKEVGTREKWNKLGFYPKNKDSKGYVVVPKKYTDENGEIRQGYQVEPFFTPESFKNIEIKKRNESGQIEHTEVKDLSRVAAVKFHEDRNDFQTARTSRYDAYVIGLNKVELNKNIKMNPAEAFKSNAIEYVAMRDLRVTKSGFNLGEYGNNFDVKNIKPEKRESFLRDIHKGAQAIISVAEKQLKDAPKFTRDMFKDKDKTKER